jgi:2-oxoisovalerate dehydrogenase E1 component beta subunit
MQLTYLEAIRQGIWEEMERDPTVFCIGEDIGIYGGAFKVTDGFIDRFGPERVIDTPIAESAIVGAAFGASLTGMRPVAEFQFMDFIGCAFNQIVNMVAKTHYLWGAPAPLVIARPQRRHMFTAAPFTRRIRRCGSCTRPASKWSARPRPTTRKA